MKNPSQKNSTIIHPFQSGQIWKMEGSNVRIGEVGKTLVEYKVLKGGLNRGTLRLTGKPALQEFLRLRKAVLVC